MKHLLNTFSKHYRRKYGGQAGKIPLDLGLTCPNRSKGGCIYCRPASFTPLHLDPRDSIAAQLERGKKALAKRNVRFLFGYFQQETVTAAPLDELLPVLHRVLTETGIIGIILSTRPDYLGRDLVAALTELHEQTGKEILIELGLQSAHDRSLRFLNRNHDFSDYVRAAELVRGAEGVQLGAHLIFGIPGESTQDMLTSVRRACESGVDALKLHHLQVIRSTPLHAMHCKQPVPVFSRDAYLKLLSEIIPHIPPQVVIHRLWSTSHPDLLVAPRWDLHAYQLTPRLEALLRDKKLYQGKFASGYCNAERFDEQNPVNQ